MAPGRYTQGAGQAKTANTAGAPQGRTASLNRRARVLVAASVLLAVFSLGMFVGGLFLSRQVPAAEEGDDMAPGDAGAYEVYEGDSVNIMLPVGESDSPADDSQATTEPDSGDESGQP